MRNLLFLVGIALAAIDGNEAVAQNRTTFVVDGGRDDWGGGAYGDPWYDVVPDTNSTADIGVFDYGWGEYGPLDEKRELFAFLLGFVAPPFQGSEPTTMELFFDLSMDRTFGELTPPWSDFRADYCVGVTGQDGRLTEFHRRYVGNKWDITSGTDIAQVEIALSGHWLEGAVPWSALGNPEAPADPDRYLPFRFAFRVSQGRFHDYVPNAEEGVLEHGLTVVVPHSWGRIKQR
ncbi:MAG: hypothetical protein OXG13_03225 [Gemmatimonadaceae bacterium]|nr:hypothetical protein [Gemmatimonadaceae bacterium]